MLTKKDVLEIYELLRNGTPHKVIAEKYSISEPTVSNIRAGRKWKSLYDFDNPIPPAKKNTPTMKRAENANLTLSDNEKVCSRCGQVKLKSEFYTRTASSDGLNASCKKCFEKNRSPVNREGANKASVKHKHKVKAEAFSLLGNKCSHCDYDEDPRALQVDHIKANHGQPQRSYLRAGHGLYIAIRNSTLPLEDFQLLCANCNWIKRNTNNEIGSPPTKDLILKNFVGPEYEIIRADLERLEKKREWGQISRERVRDDILDLYGRECNHCGYDENPAALQVDHIEQAEEAHNEYGRAGEGLYRLIRSGKKDKDDFQLLCCNCNFLKRYTEQEHRHKV